MCTCMCVCVCTRVHMRAWRGAGILGLDMLFTCFSFKKLSVGLHQAWLFFFMGASVNIFKFQLRLFEGVFTVRNNHIMVLLFFFFFNSCVKCIH